MGLILEKKNDKVSLFHEGRPDLVMKVSDCTLYIQNQGRNFQLAHACNLNYKFNTNVT